MKKDSTDVLYVSEYLDKKFASPIEVTRGKDWFVNWADFPVMGSFNKSGKYAISWLQKSNLGTYDYDIHIAISDEKLHNWDTQFVLHKDSIAAEHGFLNLASYGEHIAASWLDGRNTKLPDGNYGNMALRHAVFNEHGEVLESIQLDDRVCDCCQIDMAIDNQDKYIAFRDRSKLEYRDNKLKIFKNNNWSDNINLDKEHWKIAGCPVNGPAIALGSSTLATLSFTNIEDDPSVWLKIAAKDDLQEINRIKINENYTIGRVDIVNLHGDLYATSWIEQAVDIYQVHIATYDSNTRKLQSIAQVPIDYSRKSGVPRMVLFENKLFLVFVDVNDQEFRVKTIHVALHP